MINYALILRKLVKHQDMRLKRVYATRIAMKQMYMQLGYILNDFWKTC